MTASAPSKIDDEVVASDVGGDEARVRELDLRQAPRDADDLADRRVGAKRAQHARSDVPGRAGDDDAHQLAGGGIGLACSARATASRFCAAVLPVVIDHSRSSVVSHSSSPGPGPLFQNVQACAGIV